MQLVSLSTFGQCGHLGESVCWIWCRCLLSKLHLHQVSGASEESLGDGCASWG